MKKNYSVKYRVNTTTTTTTLLLYGGTESEAIDKLKQRGTVAKDATVIILLIQEA